MNQKSSKYSEAKNQEQQLTQLTKVRLEQLEQVVAGAGDPEGESPDESPDGLHLN